MLTETSAMIIAYVLGSLSGSLLLGKLINVDIRQSGSGNAGSTNAYRTQGSLFAIFVLMFDLGKGVLATAFIASWLIDLLGSPLWLSDSQLQLFCGFFVIFGHVFPVFHGFRGGKGAATLLGVFAVLAPMALLFVLSLWTLSLILTGYVSLATLVAVVASLPATAYMAGTVMDERVVFSMFTASLIIVAHRVNIRKLLAGTEHCFEKAKLLNR